MRKLIVIITIALLSLPQSAWSQGDRLSMAELFKTMPDSLLPYLTTNNRLDMLDFRAAKMKAAVTNKLECESEMTALTSDSLSVRMSESLRVDMFTLPTEEVYDSCQYVICMLKTYLMQGEPAECVAAFFTSKWRQLGDLPQYSSKYVYSSILRKDEELPDKKTFR